MHSLHHPPHSHHSGTSPPEVWPLEGDHMLLPPSVGYNHPEEWVGHGQYSKQPTTCTNELNVSELNVGGGVLLGCMCVCTTTSSVMFAVVAVCVGGRAGDNTNTCTGCCLHLCIIVCAYIHTRVSVSCLIHKS